MQSCDKIAELSHNSNDIGIQIEGLDHAEELYNIANILNQPQFIKKSLGHMANLHKALGDNSKAESLSQLAVTVEADNYGIIKKFGSTTSEVIEIKKMIQESHLDPVREAAAIGKWTNMQLGSYFIPQEQGVQAYLPTRGPNESKDSYEIKMSLIFEAINLAAVQSKNPTCTIIFAKNYPDIVKKVMNKHPEYFVNKDILHLCAEQINVTDLKDLTGVGVLTRPIHYNSHSEKSMIPIIEKRLVDDGIIKNVENIILKSSWNPTTEQSLLKILNPNIGNNLSKITGAIDIARELIVKAVVENIAKNSGNYAPFVSICKNLPDLVRHIYEDNCSYLGRDEVVLNHAKSITLESESQDSELAGVEENI
ncbi:MAG: hypothetical protein H6909_03875 [Rickettsiaceae bacterium]|nr:hypothetical protein [Rickettsiaceae bacterium]